MENNITYHLQNIFKTEELEESRTTQKIRVVQNEGTRKVSREVIFYSLDTIIAVGYIVNSNSLINILKEYIIKEFALNKEEKREP
ncbi:MAG: RhuM family protein [Bacilli bacterium]